MFEVLNLIGKLFVIIMSMIKKGGVMGKTKKKGKKKMGY